MRHIYLGLVSRIWGDTGRSIDLRDLNKNAADKLERRILQSYPDRGNGDVRVPADALGITPRVVHQKLGYHGFGNGRE